MWAVVFVNMAGLMGKAWNIAAGLTAQDIMARVDSMAYHGKADGMSWQG